MEPDEDPKVFKKRSGTTDKGKQFEDLIVAFIVEKLVADDGVKDFELSSNNKKFGSFDDIVLQTETKITRRYALQLKHFNTTKNLSLKSLESPKGKLSIHHYFQDFKKHQKNFQGFDLILFTNLLLNDVKNVIIKVDKTCSVKPEPSDCIQHMKTNDKGKCYKFVITEESQASEDHQLFFQQFFLCTNQSSCDQLHEDLENKMQTSFQDKDIFTKFCKFISKWSELEGYKNILTKTMMHRVFALFLLERFIVPIIFKPIGSNEKIFQEAISKFDVTVFDKRSTQMVQQMWGEIVDHFKDLSKINNLRKKYQIADKSVDNINELSSEDCSKYLWLSGKCPLILQDDSAIYKALSICKKNFIILSSNKSISQQHEVFSKLTDLEEHTILYQNITNQLMCSMPGRNIKLAQLIEEEQIKHNVTTDVLIQMTKGPYKIIQEEEKLPDPHIERLVSRNIIDIKYLQTLDFKTLVFISNVDEPNVITRKINQKCLVITSVNDAIGKNVDDPRIFLLKSECLEDLSKIYQESGSFNKCHHFRFDNGKLEWIKSYGTTLDIVNHKIVSDEFTKEHFLYNTDFNNKVFLIADEPGKGKSVLLKSLKNHFCSNLPTILMTSPDISFLCSENNCDNFEHFLLNVKFKNYSLFDKSLLEYLFKNNQIIFMWDALDEISNEQHVKIIIRLIKSLSGRNYIQWITCRPHLKQILENELCVLARNMTKFSDEQINSYIHKRLQVKFSNIEDVTSKLNKYLAFIKSNDLLGVPIQIYMLTELILQNTKYIDLMNGLFSVADLYDYCFEEKLKGNDHKNSLNFEDLKKYKMQHYQRAALMALFDQTLLDRLPSFQTETFLKEIRKHDRYGFITYISEDTNKVDFVHTSYAEFFAAKYFVDNIKEISEVKNIIFDVKYNNVRFFFDMIMAGSSEIHIAVLYNNYGGLLRQPKDNLVHKDRGGRNLLHVASSWGERYPPLDVENQHTGNAYIVKDEANYVVKKDNPQFLLILNYLLDLKLFDAFAIDDIFKMSSMSYAETCDCLYVMALIEQKQNIGYLQSLVNSRNCQIPCSILYYSVQFGYDHVITIFRNIKFIETSSDTLLHLVVERHHTACLKKLLEIDSFKKNIESTKRSGMTPLFLACSYGFSDMVEILEKSGARGTNVKSTKITPLIAYENGWKPLHTAASENQIFILLQLAASTDANSLDIGDKQGYTPLHLACRNGHLQSAEILIRLQSDINASNLDGLTPLHSAVKNKHINIVNKLVTLKDINVNAVARDRFTPRHFAAQDGHIELTRTLISSGSDPNITNKAGLTAFNLAISNGHVEVATILKDLGDSINTMSSVKKDTTGAPKQASILMDLGDSTNAMSSIKKDSTDAPNQKDSRINEYVYKQYETSTDESQPLHSTVRIGNTAKAKLLIESGVNVNAQDINGATPLCLAAQNGYDNAVELLLKNNADTNIPEHNGFTPLIGAVMNNYYKTAHTLLKFGANINAVDKDNSTSLSWATYYDHFSLVELLVKNGADVNIADKNGLAPVYWSSYSNGYESVRLLVESGADVNAASEYGLTPLHVAAENGHDSVVELLLSSGADVNSCTKNSETALIYACTHGHYKVADLLVKHNADVKWITNTGSTPLSIATEYDHSNIKELLLASGATSRNLTAA